MRKRCSKCKVELSADMFHRDSHSRDGLTSNCKACRNARSLAWFYENHTAQRAQSLARYNANKEDISRRRSAARQLDLPNRLTAERAARAKDPERYRAYVRAWQNRNPEYNNARKRAWEKANPVSKKIMIARYRARLKSMRLHPVSRADLEMRVSVFGDVCAYCGAPWTHLDHVKPIALGGPHCLSNLRPACAPCNRRKSSKPHRQWFSELKGEQP